jgi:hypothetical protein
MYFILVWYVIDNQLCVAEKFLIQFLKPFRFKM